MRDITIKDIQEGNINETDMAEIICEASIGFINATQNIIKMTKSPEFKKNFTRILFVEKALNHSEKRGFLYKVLSFCFWKELIMKHEIGNNLALTLMVVAIASASIIKSLCRCSINKTAIQEGVKHGYKVNYSS